MAEDDKKEVETKTNSSRKLVVEEVENGSGETSAEKSSEDTSTEGSGEKESTDEDSSSEVSDVSDETEEEEKEVVETVEEDEAEQDSPPPQITLKQVLMIAIPTAIVVAALTGGILYYLNSNGSIEIASSPTPEPTLVAEESPTPEPESLVERSEVTVEVLNGSGVAGYAGDVKDLLEDLGYVDVETGNADTYDFTETVVAIKEESEDYLDMVVEDLSEVYVVAEDAETLDDESEFDIVITVGSELQ